MGLTPERPASRQAQLLSVLITVPLEINQCMRIEASSRPKGIQELDLTFLPKGRIQKHQVEAANLTFEVSECVSRPYGAALNGELFQRLAQVTRDRRMRVDELNFAGPPGQRFEPKRSTSRKKVKASSALNRALKPVEKCFPHLVGSGANRRLGPREMQVAVPEMPGYDPYAIWAGSGAGIHRPNPERLRKSAANRKLNGTAKKEPSHAEVYPSRSQPFHPLSGCL